MRVHYSLVLVHSRDTWCLSVSPGVLFCRSICPGCRIPQLVEPSGPQACHHIRGSAGTHHWAPPPAVGGGGAPKGEERRRWGGGSAGVPRGVLRNNSCFATRIVGALDRGPYVPGCACVYVNMCVRGARAGGPWSDVTWWLTATGLKSFT